MQDTNITPKAEYSIVSVKYTYIEPGFDGTKYANPNMIGSLGRSSDYFDKTVQYGSIASDKETIEKLLKRCSKHELMMRVSFQYRIDEIEPFDKTEFDLLQKVNTIIQ